MKSILLLMFIITLSFGVISTKEPKEYESAYFLKGWDDIPNKKNCKYYAKRKDYIVIKKDICQQKIRRGDFRIVKRSCKKPCQFLECLNYKDFACVVYEKF